MTQEFIYVISWPGSAVAKIGYSNKPVERLAILQCGSPHPLEIVAMFPGGQATEAYLHATFSKNRTSGEWFELGDSPGSTVAEAIREMSFREPATPPQPGRPKTEGAQATRMIKAICPSCSCIIRMTRKWMSAGLPTCQCGTKFETED